MEYVWVEVPMEYVLMEGPDKICLAGEIRWSKSGWRDPME